MINRISILLKSKNISAAKFADEIDVQRSSISHILSGRNNPSLEFIQKILKTYPEISPEWLISGKGSILKNLDLFENMEERNQENNKNLTEIKTTDIPKEKDVTNKPKDLIQTKSLSKEDKISEKVNTISNKKIEKIMVFYTDATFKEYIPE